MKLKSKTNWKWNVRRRLSSVQEMFTWRDLNYNTLLKILFESQKLKNKATWKLKSKLKHFKNGVRLSELWKMDWNSLPLEVWILIWRHLDFETLQKSGTLVSKTWFKGIWSDTILSGELALKLKRKEQLDGEEISDILSKWKMLRVNFKY